MKVYHGSDTLISVIDLQECKPNRDFGRGFYVTKLHSQADDMAIRVTQYSKKSPVVTEYEFDEYAFEDNELKVLRFDNYDEKWLEFVVLNRNADKRKQPHDYDIVEGPVADDKITRNITKYLQGEISKEKFLEMLTHSKPNHQICFCTVNSLQMLEYVEKSAKKSKFQVEDISEPLVEQLMLDLQIGEMKAADIFYSSATFTQLADTDTKLYEKEWQEIYKILKTELNF
ncbi:hypothetical protein EZS27_027892 [termite gut metagenome]|uniref:DUF3990 domain-containing protein n=1 Tax=termite gut metagenome TaxID=433724 RepID=A0A5J4QN82_9ZZZZ